MNEELNYVGDAGGDQYLDVLFYKGLHDGEEKDFVRIGVPGDKTLTIDTLADDVHKRRFARQWAAYEGIRSLNGTSLDEWDEISDSYKRELNYQGFKFVEQLASAPDAAFARLMGGTQLRDKARAFLDRGKISSDAVIKNQAQQIQELQEKMAILMEALNDKPKRGRPPVDKEE
jgi:hypothetical protein